MTQKMSGAKEEAVCNQSYTVFVDWSGRKAGRQAEARNETYPSDLFVIRILPPFSFFIIEDFAFGNLFEAF